MRTSPFVFAAAVAFAAAALVAPASAFTAAPAALEAAAAEVSVTDTVHCRTYRHWHRYDGRRTTGCNAGVIVHPRRSTDVYIRRGSRAVIRDRDRGSVSIRSGSRTRTDTTIRSGERGGHSGVSVRSRQGGSDVNMRSSGSRGGQGGEINARSRGGSATTGSGRQGAGGNSGGGATIEKRQPGQ
jgi:hypothetical protein